MSEEESCERLRDYYRERVMSLLLGFKDDGIFNFFFLSAELIWQIFFTKINLHRNNLVPSQIYGS